MKKLLLFGISIALFVLTACSSDAPAIDNSGSFRRGTNTPASDYFEYKIDFTSPNKIDKGLNYEMPINIDFKSSTGKTVHYIEIRIFNKLDSTEVYNQPSDNHVDNDNGSHNFTDTFTLSVSNGISSDTDWILEAKVWGTNPEEEDVIMSLEFHVN
jgi:hypothetical protein